MSIAFLPLYLLGQFQDENCTGQQDVTQKYLAQSRKVAKIFINFLAHLASLRENSINTSVQYALAYYKSRLKTS
jgi:hypothetical protein